MSHINQKLDWTQGKTLTISFISNLMNKLVTSKSLESVKRHWVKDRARTKLF